MKLSRLLVILVLFVAATSAFSADYQPRYLEITFFSTNDLHANDLPFTIPADPKTNRREESNVGGLARISAIVGQAREDTRTHVVLADCGDTSYGYTKLSRRFHGASVIAAMNAMGYDIMEPGNHDFQWHSRDTIRNHKNSQFPWVCANLVDAKTGKLYLQPYVVRNIGGVQVAFLGLITDLPQLHPDKYPAFRDLGLKVLPGIDVAAKMVPELRKQADIVVVLSHLGRSLDVALAQKVPGIDVILGGHSHSLLRTPQMVKIGEPSAYSIGVVPVVQAGSWGRWLGRTNVVFHRGENGRYTLMSCKGDVVTIDRSIPDDPRTAKLLKDWAKRVPTPAPAPAQPAPAK